MGYDILKIIGWLRKNLLLRLPLPATNPDILSGLSIITSVLFVISLKYSSIFAFMLIMATLLLDLFDGAVARKYKKESEEGRMIDIAADRLSEGIMFVPFFVPWFFLFTLNCFLTLFSFKKRIHVILPLRHAFLVYFFLFFII